MLNDIEFIRYLIDLLAQKSAMPTAPSVVVNINNK